MRLLFVIDNLGTGGAQRQLVTLALGLHHRGHKVDFFTYYPQNGLAGPLTEAEIPIYHVPKRNRLGIGVLLGLRRRITEGQYDVVLSFLDTPNFYAEAACLGLRRPLLVVSERSTEIPGRSKLTRRLLMQCHRFADWVTVNSYHQRDRMLVLYPWLGRKIKTIYNGVDLSTFGSRAQTEARNRLRLLALGTIVSLKNPRNIVRALKYYRDHYGDPPVICWAGKRGTSHDADVTFTEVNGLLENLGVADCWEWLGERGDVPQLLQAHDALIHASLFEGLPNAICEALASARPVLASDVCDHPKLIQDSKTGYLFNPLDPASIAEAIRRFCKLSSDRRIAMGLTARTYAEEYLSMAKLVDEYESLFRHLLEGRPQRLS